MNIPENFDRWMFDYKEGNLSGAEKDAFESFLIQNPHFEVEADAWNNSFIQNEEFVYPNAGALEKDNRVVAFYWAAAALALLLIGTSAFLLTRDNGTEVNGISATNDATVETAIEASTLSAQTVTNNHSALNTNDADLSANNNGVVSWNIANNFNNPQGNGNNSSNPNYNNQLANNGNGLNNQGQLMTNGDNMNPLGNGNSTVGLNNGSNDVAISPEMTDPTMSKLSLDQELAKWGGDDYNSMYQGNPMESDLAFDVSKKQSYDFSKNKFKRFWRKVKKAFDVPPTSLTNLGDPEILMPNGSILANNPGFTGGMNGSRFELNYRNQWFGDDQNSQMMTAAFDAYVPGMRGGVGMMIGVQDHGYGQFQDYNLSLMYSPKILFGQNVVFEPAIKLTMGMMNANGEKLTPDGQFEMDRGRILNTPAAQQMQGSQQLWYKDYGLGFVVNTKKFYAGFSADNLNRHYENVYSNEGYATPTSSPVRMNALVGFDFDSKYSQKPLSASPFVAYNQYGERKELWAGVNTRLNWFTIGGSVNQNLDFTAAVGMKFPKFKLVYHYDHTRSYLSEQQIGSHNIGIRFNTAKGGRKPANFKG